MLLSSPQNATRSGQRQTIRSLPELPTTAIAAVGPCFPTARITVSAPREPARSKQRRGARAAWRSPPRSRGAAAPRPPAPAASAARPGGDAPAAAARRGTPRGATSRTQRGARSAGRARQGRQPDPDSWSSLRIRLAEADAAACKERLDGLDAAAQRSRDLRHRQPVGVPQHERDPLRGRDGGKRAEGAAVGLSRQRRACGSSNADCRTRRSSRR